MSTTSINQDLNLLTRLKEGNEEAWRILFDRHYQLLCKYANHFVNDSFLAEMVVGDVFYNLWKICDTLDINTDLRSYLLKAVRNTSVNIMNSKYHRMETTFSELTEDDSNSLDYLSSLSDGSHPMGRLLEKELEEEILAAINRLPDESQKVFLLSRRDGKSYAEISAELGISVNTVKYHMKQALSTLRNELNPYLMLFLTCFLHF